jgi:hypothetical protein
MRRLVAALAACLAPAATCALADEGETTYGAGLHYSSGDYGASRDTEITSLLFSVARETGPWRLKLSVPYLEVTGPATVIPGVGNVGDDANGRGRGAPRRDGSAGSGTATGLGDIVGAATYALYSGGGAALDATGRVKLPTADADDGLGTGETDVGFQIDAYQAIDRLTPFIGIGYTFFGDPAFAELDDAMNYTVGATYRIDGRDSAGLSLDGRERVSRGSAEQRELVAFWMRRFPGPWRAQLYFLKGLADGSPDWGLGATAGYVF